MTVEENQANEENPAIDNQEAAQEPEAKPEDSTPEQEADDNGEDKGDSEKPEWLQDAQELANLAAGKAKAKERTKQEKLRAKLEEEKNSELERLKAELEQARSGNTDPVKPKRPRESEFETFDEYEQALDKYDEDFLSYNLNAQRSLTAKQQREQAAKEVQSQTQAKRLERVNKHYERAAEFVDTLRDQGVTEEVYQSADMMFRKSLGNDDIADVFIEKLGEGSEKVVMAIGVNATKREKLKELIKGDSTGFEAMVYLAEQKALVNSGGKRSSANKPAPVVKGNGGNTSSLAKAYKDAIKAGDAQKAYNIKKQARSEKIDTKQW